MPDEPTVAVPGVAPAADPNPNSPVHETDFPPVPPPNTEAVPIETVEVSFTPNTDPEFTKAHITASEPESAGDDRLVVYLKLDAEAEAQHYSTIQLLRFADGAHAMDHGARHGGTVSKLPDGSRECYLYLN